MPKKVKAWKHNESGELFHDRCFEEGESREGYKAVSLDDLDTDDECGACSGPFVSDRADDIDEDLDDNDSEDKTDDD